MFSKGFVGIKTKLILAIVIILSLTTAFNLYFTYITFKTDKEAYIFEAAQRSRQTAIEKLTLRIEHIIKITNETQKTVQTIEDNSIKGIFWLNNKILKKLYLDEDTQIQNELIIKEVNDLLKLGREGLSATKINNLHLLLLNDIKNNVVKVSLVDLSHDLSYFSNDPVFKYYIKIGQMISNDNEKTSFENLEKNFSGTKIFEDNLISKSENKNFNLTIISYINTKKAYSVIEYILIKNIAFSLIILGLCLFITVLFSNKLTKPIFQIIEKTKAIANGNYETTLMVETNDELRSLGKSVSTMSSKIMQLLSDKEVIIKELEVANKKLDDYSKNLEVKVAERTKELSEANTFIKTMINSLDQGLFVFNKESQIADIYTKACVNLFDQELKSKKVPEVLNLDEKEAVNFTKWSELIFANKIPFESAKVLGPKKYTKGNVEEEDDFKHIEINYYPIFDTEENLKNVVAVATDKTNEILAQESFKKKDDFVTMLLKIVKNKASFISLIEESKNLIHELINFEEQDKIINKAMIVFHTLFGGLASYNIYDLSKLARKNEDYIKSITTIDSESEQKIKQLAGQYLESLNEFFNDTISKIKSGDNIIEIEKEDLEQLRLELENISKDASNVYKNIFEKSRVKSFFDSYKTLVSTLSEKTEKPMQDLVIEDNGIRIDKTAYNEFFSTLIHLFRNCMDHGIEKLQKREELGKNASGKISVTANDMNNYIQIKITDDGAGINTSKVKQKLCEILGEEKANMMSEEEINMAIFLPSLSTADKLTELSGRGVGMSAIKDAIDKIGGSIELKTSVNVGTDFIFNLPKLN